MSAERFALTNPYGSLEFVIGTADDFICFDYHVDEENKRVLLHAVINSETGSFIQDFEAPAWVSYRDDLLAPYNRANELVGTALDWCAYNNCEHDEVDWNQDPRYFARAVHAAVTHAPERPIRIAVEMVRRPINTRNY